MIIDEGGGCAGVVRGGDGVCLWYEAVRCCVYGKSEERTIAC
jgi:hypothetical protein